jgi:ABC-type protease/lipase transport system fused ATPase/permease subunit
MLLFSRALSPIEKLVGSWQAFIDARQALVRVNELLLNAPIDSFATQLPQMEGRMDFENVTYAPGQSGRPTLKGVKVSIRPGETLGVIGPSGAGKSTFLKLAAGILSPSVGTVRVDGASMHVWDRTHFGRFVGYLPQDVELFSGTVTENICRFGEANHKELFKATRLAGVHDLILRLPQGYDTQLGEGGSVLSAGQRQRVGLARAIYGMPRLVLLDEPNANLDGEGEAALFEVLKVLKASKASVIIISHRPAGLATADNVLLLRNGTAEHFGPRDLVLAQLRAAQASNGPADAPVVKNRPAAEAPAVEKPQSAPSAG